MQRIGIRAWGGERADRGGWAYGVDEGVVRSGVALHARPARNVLVPSDIQLIDAILQANSP